MSAVGRSTGGRLPRAQRREQILAAATEAFARNGYADTGLEEIAAEAGVSRVILYRHFDSKAELYRAVLASARQRLHDVVGEPDYSERIVDALLSAAAEDPAGFRLLFHHAPRESQFRAESDTYRDEMTATARQQITAMIPDPAWVQWAALLAPTVTIAAITAWLDAGQPDPETAAERIKQTVVAVVDAARRPPAA